MNIRKKRWSSGGSLSTSLQSLYDVTESYSCDWLRPTRVTTQKHDCAIAVVPQVPFNRAKLNANVQLSCRLRYFWCGVARILKVVHYFLRLLNEKTPSVTGSGLDSLPMAGSFKLNKVVFCRNGPPKQPELALSLARFLVQGRLSCASALKTC